VCLFPFFETCNNNLKNCVFVDVNRQLTKILDLFKLRSSEQFFDKLLVALFDRMCEV